MEIKQILDIAYLGLMNQNARSMDGPNCAYRSPNGHRCAVGMFIDDPALALNWDTVDITCGTAISTIVAKKKIPENLKWMVKHVDLLSSLQTIHDSWRSDDSISFRDHITNEFRIHYNAYGLEMPLWKETSQT